MCHITSGYMELTSIQQIDKIINNKSENEIDEKNDIIEGKICEQ